MRGKREAPPHNIDAERAVLGAMLVTRQALAPVIEEIRVEPDDFYLDRHREIFAVIRELHAGSQPVDEISVYEALTKRKSVEEAGGRQYVSLLASAVPAAGNAKHYAEIIQRHSGARQRILSAERIQEAVRSGRSPATDLKTLRELLGNESRAEIKTVRGSDVTLRATRFLDEDGMIPLRSITVVVGPAGLGKTTYGVKLAADITAARMPGLDRAGDVLISSLEDDAEAVLAPRLVAAGAEMMRVHFVAGLSIPSGVPKLEARARTLGASFVLIDPIGAHFDSSIDSHRDASTRSALTPLAEMATALDLAVMVIAHPNKSAGRSGLERISGSGAFGNAARSVVVFGRDPGDPEGETGARRVVAHLKSNVGRLARSKTAELTTCPVATEDGESQVPVLRITGFSDHGADDILSTPNVEERTERDAAKDFLRALLSDGGVSATDVKAAAADADLKWRTIERAKKEIGIESIRQGTAWLWELPEGSR